MNQTLIQKHPDLTENDTIIRPIPPQQAFLTSKVRYPAFVGGWATGKSLIGIGKSMQLTQEYDNNLGAVFRKEYTDLKDSTIKDFETYTGLKVDSSREIRLPNGSIIMFRHLEELNNLQNINLGWFWIEQAEELETDEPFFMLFGRLRRKHMPNYGFITANTRGHNWIYRLWKLNTLEDSALFEAKTQENAKNLSAEFLKSLDTLKDKKPSIYRRFVENSWEDSDTSDVIIQSTWVDAALGRILNIQPPLRRVIGIDVARYGDDKTVFYAMEMGARQEVQVLGRQQWEKTSTMETVGKAVIFAKRHNINAFAVDEIGVGAGVADRLNELEHQVIYVNSAKKSTRPDVYFNIRSEMYQHGADQLEAERVSLDPEDEELREELCWAKYKTVKSNGVFQIESKDDIKKRYGRSPDSSDAFLGGLWGLQFVEPVTQKDRYKLREEKDRIYEDDPMSV